MQTELLDLRSGFALLAHHALPVGVLLGEQLGDWSIS